MLSGIFCMHIHFLHCLSLCRICEGFRDADGTREFLFALPRFARDEVENIMKHGKIMARGYSTVPEIYQKQT